MSEELAREIASWAAALPLDKKPRIDPRTAIPLLVQHTLALSPDSTIVEVGTGYGSSAAIFAKARDDVVIHTIDDGSNFERYVRKGSDLTYREFIEGNFELFGVSGRIQWHLARSQEIEWAGPIHLLFIDGDHSYEGVKGDIKNLSPHVIHSGIIIFHDYPSMIGVRQAVDELLSSREAVVIDRAHNILAVRKEPSQNELLLQRLKAMGYVE